MCSDPKHLAMLNAVAEQTGQQSSPPQGVHRGQAQIMGWAAASPRRPGSRSLTVNRRSIGSSRRRTSAIPRSARDECWRRPGPLPPIALAVGVRCRDRRPVDDRIERGGLVRTRRRTPPARWPTRSACRSAGRWPRPWPRSRRASADSLASARPTAGAGRLREPRS